MNNAKPTYVVEADRLLSSHPRDLWAYRELFILLVKRDFVAVYKQTVLGPLWFFVQPFLASLVFMIVFGQIARLPTTELPPLVFYMSGIIVWSFFSNCLTQVAATFLTNGPIFRKIYFPRLIMPLSQIGTNVLNFVPQLAVLFVVVAFYELTGRGIELSPRLFALPLILGLNPMASFVECYRSSLFGTEHAQVEPTVTAIVITLVVAAAGIACFKRAERTFTDTI